MPPSTRSRRERPAKPALSRDGIVAETIRIVRAEGLDRATVRRVAQALDTGPASLYVYIANTAELHAAVLDELLGPLRVRRVGDWSSRLHALLRDYQQVLFAHPGLARSALVLRPTGANTVRLHDRVLGLLLDGGVEPHRAAWGVDLLLQHVTADAAEHSAPSPGDVDAPADDAAEWDAMTRALRTADPAEAPHVAEHVDALLDGAPEQRVTWALDVLVAGITATATPQTQRDGTPDPHHPTTTSTEDQP